jgi:DNA primase
VALTREDTAKILIHKGYKVTSNWKLKLRDEQTPSAIINKDGRVHDFGDGFHGDIYDILKVYHQLSFIEAKKEINRILGLTNNIDFSTFDNTNNKELDKRPLPENFMSQYLIDRKENFRLYSKELNNLFLGEYQGKQLISANKTSIIQIAKTYQIGYSKKSGRLIMPLRDINNQIRTFWKYKKYGQDVINNKGDIVKHKKVILTKNKFRPPFSILDLSAYRKNIDLPIIITEGEKDTLVTVANGFRAICVGGTGASKRLPPEYLDLFKNFKIILAGDYDDAGQNFNYNLTEQFKSIASSVTSIDWEKKSIKDGFALHDKFDLTDYFAWKYNRKK